MAARMTRRDTSGERGWQDGAGVSWTSPHGGGKQQWQEREPIEAENPPNDGSQQPRTGIFNDLAVSLGFRRAAPKGYQRSDERIREDVCEHLWHASHLDVSDVSVEVDHCVVRLEGTVPHRQMKHRIEDIAASCAGVDEVENRIRVVHTS